MLISRGNKKENARATTSIPYPRPVGPRVAPIARTQPRSMSQTPPAKVPSVSVPIGLSRHSHQLQQLRPHRKKHKQLRTALECVPSGATITTIHHFRSEYPVNLWMGGEQNPPWPRGMIAGPGAEKCNMIIRTDKNEGSDDTDVAPRVGTDNSSTTMPVPDQRASTITGDHSSSGQILLVKMDKYIPGRFLCIP